MEKKTSRLRRARQTRLKLRELRATRLSVHRTNQHIYATVISSDGARVLATASTLEPALRQELGGKPGVGADVGAASLVGRRIAERALAAGISEVSFDRSGFRYHGRVKALAEAAREAGLKF